jgi:hypothetical protein
MLEELIYLKEYQNIDIKINQELKTNEGIVFIYPSWSIDQRYLKVLLNCMVKKNVTQPIYIFDIDEDDYKKFERQYNIKAQGKGEIFLIDNGTILTKILSHENTKPEDKINELLDIIK